MRIVDLARPNLVGCVLTSNILMFFITAWGGKWECDLLLPVVRSCQASWSVDCWPVQQSETEAALLSSQVVALDIVVGKIMSNWDRLCPFRPEVGILMSYLFVWFGRDCPVYGPYMM